VDLICVGLIAGLLLVTAWLIRAIARLGAGS